MWTQELRTQNANRKSCANLVLRSGSRTRETQFVVKTLRKKNTSIQIFGGLEPFWVLVPSSPPLFWVQKIKYRSKAYLSKRI